MPYNENFRVRIVDVTHLFYKFAFSRVPEMTAVVQINGQNTVVSTKVPALTVKALFRWSFGGAYPLFVAFDTKGSTRGRIEYFQRLASQSGVITGGGYKGSRTSQNDLFYRNIEITKSLLTQGGVQNLAYPGYEADDIIKAAVDRAKIDYPNACIDIITGDADLLPLVDEQVSVWYNSKKTTYAKPGLQEITSYIQVTPENYQSVIEGLTACKGLHVPYNTILLTKLLRGDKSDEIPGYPKFTPTMYNALIDNLIKDGVDIGNLFRYDKPIDHFFNKQTGMEIPREVARNMPKQAIERVFEDPITLQNMLKILSKYLNDAQLQHIRNVYNGINLNCAFTGGTAPRNPMVINSPITGFDEVQFRSACYNPFQINLPNI